MNSRIESPTTVAWITVALFLFTLGSYYFYNLELYVFQVVGVFLALPLFRLRFLNGTHGRLGVLVLIFVYTFFVGAIQASIGSNTIFTPSKLTLPIFFAAWLAFSAVLFGGYPREAQKALRIVIWTHIGFFLLQFLWYIFTFQFIDFLEPFTGESQRALGGSYEVALLPVFLRATGLFNEPGTYSTWMIVLLLLFREHARRLGEQGKDRYLEIVGVGTVLLSFSTFGMIFSSLYILMLLTERKFNVKTIVVVLILVSPLAFVAFEYLGQRMQLGSESSGLGFRFEALTVYAAGVSANALIMGLGMFTDFFTRADPLLVYMDVGLWFVIFISVGIIGTILILAYFIVSVPRNIVAIVLLIVVMLSKLPLTNPLTWVVFSYYIWAGMRISDECLDAGSAKFA